MLSVKMAAKLQDGTWRNWEISANSVEEAKEVMISVSKSMASFQMEALVEGLRVEYATARLQVRPNSALNLPGQSVQLTPSGTPTTQTKQGS